MKNRPEGRLDEISVGTLILHPAAEQKQRREHWRHCVEAWRSERDWMLLIDHRHKLRGHLGEVVAL